MLGSRAQILVTEDEANLRMVLAAQLGREGYDVHTACDGRQAIDILQDNHIDLVITDLRMPNVDGMQLLRHALTLDPDLLVIILTAYGTVDNAVEALKTGTFDYITKPFDLHELRTLVAKALRTRELSAAEPDGELIGRDDGIPFGIIRTNAAIRRMPIDSQRVSDMPTAVLITGESGTGKARVARAMHDHSSRANRAFIRVNCAAIPAELIDSELFGYERTGLGQAPVGSASKPGRFELACTGTLLLDEIGELPMQTQANVLRALQHGEIQRVGGVSPIRVDVRLIASSTRDLRKQIAVGTFRQDLYDTLNAMHLEVPPLRSRTQDIELLCMHFIARFNQRLDKSVHTVSPDALQILQAYHWPGNVGELENVIERAVLFCDTGSIEPQDLPPEVRKAPDAASALVLRNEVIDAVTSGTEGLKEQVRAARMQVERELIARALVQTKDNVTHAARMLKISRKGLQLKMKELGLRCRDERSEPAEDESGRENKGET